MRERWHGFDRLRAVAMLAVVGLHAAYAYSRHPMPGLVWPVPVGFDAGAEPGALADAFFWLAEAAVMPLFFAVSGFFSGSLSARTDVRPFLRHRVKRVLGPLGVACLTVLPLSLAVWCVGLAATGQMTWTDLRRLNPPDDIKPDLLGTGHLWYLQYLFLLAAMQAGLTGRRWTEPVLRAADRVFRSPLRPALIAVPLIAVLAADPLVYLGFPHRFWPVPAKFAHAAVCFAFGLAAWRNRDVLPRGGSVWTASLFAPAVLLSTWAALGGTGDARTTALPVGMFGGVLVSAALSRAARPSPVPRRWVTLLAGASFWVYLTHHWLVGVAHLALHAVPLPGDAKFLLAWSAAAAACVAAEPLSRRTRLGRRLVGRPEPPAIVPRPLPDAIPVRRAA